MLLLDNVAVYEYSMAHYVATEAAINFNLGLSGIMLQRRSMGIYVEF